MRRETQLSTAPRRDRSGPLAGVLILVAIIPLSALHGFVLKTLWNWFVPLAFHGAPRLDIGTAYGLSLVVSYFLPPAPGTDDDADLLHSAAEAVLASILRAAFVLVLGAIVHALIA